VSTVGIPKEISIVPKTLRECESTYLFGMGEIVLSDPKNGRPDIELTLS
jgi:hypothetical protein